MTTYREFQAELEELHRQSERARRGEAAAALSKIKALIEEYELTPAELGFETDTPRKASIGPAKYADPVTGATWSGKGRAPRWLDGKDRTQFEIR